MGQSEVCGNGIDDDFSGCIDQGCVKGKPPCTCVAACKTAACSPVPVSTCNPTNSQRELCANGADDNCNGQVDEGCAPKSPGSCYDRAGADPILLGSRSAVTEPFADFSSDTVVQLSLTRTYTERPDRTYTERPSDPTESSRGTKAEPDVLR
jgi:hypothetical protein